MVFPLRRPTEISAPWLAGKRRGKAGSALQVGPLDEAEYLGIVDLRVIVLFERAACEHGSDAEGNAHFGLQRIVKRPLGVAAGVAGRRFGTLIATVAMSSDVSSSRAARNAACAAVCAKLQAGAGLL